MYASKTHEPNKTELQEEREDSLLELETLLALFQKWRYTASKKSVRIWLNSTASSISTNN